MPSTGSPERESTPLPGEQDTPSLAACVPGVVARIPVGLVTTYGDIARACGRPRSARIVGWLMSRQEDDDLPCHRVVNHQGRLTGGWSFGHPEVMRSLLAAEGVPFIADDQVDLPRCRWTPDASGAAADEVDDLDDVTVAQDGAA